MPIRESSLLFLWPNKLAQCCFTGWFNRRTMMRDRCRRFINGRTNTHNEVGQGHKTIMIDNAVHRIDRGSIRFTISDPSTKLTWHFPKCSAQDRHWKLLCPLGSEATHRPQIRANVSDRITRSSKKMKNNYSQSWLGLAETRIQHVNSETKERSTRRMHNRFPNEPQNIKRSFSNWKMMAMVL